MDFSGYYSFKHALKGLKTIFKTEKSFRWEVFIAILVIIAAVSIPFYLNFYYRQQLDSSSNEITQILRKAQTKSVAGQDNSNFGVYFHKDDINEESRNEFYSFLLTMAIKNPFRGCEPIFELTFDTIHTALSNGKFFEYGRR